jgi:hypothetical protein
LFLGCQSNDSRTLTAPDPAGFGVVEQREATASEIEHLQAAEEIDVSPAIGTATLNLTCVLVVRNDRDELRAAYVTPLVMTENELTARIAVEVDGRFAAVVARLRGSVVNGVFAPESFELLDVSGLKGVLYANKASGSSRIISSTAATSWFDCFLQCVDRKVTSNWWLNVICGPGSPVTTYWCLWIQGGAGWAIISWCIGAASGYCP